MASVCGRELWVTSPRGQCVFFSVLKHPKPSGLSTAARSLSALLTLFDHSTSDRL